MTKVTLVNMQPSEGIVAAAKGDVSGLLSFEPFLYRLEAMGGTKYATGRQSWVTGQLQNLGPDDRLLYLNAILMAQDSWIKDKPNTVKAVMRAFDRATKFIASDRPKSVEIIQKGIKIDPAALSAIMDLNDYNSAILPTIAASISDLSNWALSIKRIPAAVKPADVIDPTLLASMNPSLVMWRP
jgi:NitT/TauT family transport system substrate-binding protein